MRTTKKKERKKAPALQNNLRKAISLQRLAAFQKENPHGDAQESFMF
jgi:hypothetical protein